MNKTENIANFAVKLKTLSLMKKIRHIGLSFAKNDKSFTKPLKL